MRSVKDGRSRALLNPLAQALTSWQKFEGMIPRANDDGVSRYDATGTEPELLSQSKGIRAEVIYVRKSLSTGQSSEP